MATETSLKDVASRVREMRELSGISIHEMSESTHMSVEDYMALEDGKVDFSFSFISKCAEKFGVDIADIMQGSSPKLSSFSLVRRGKGVPIARNENENALYASMAPNFKNKIGEPFFCRLPYNADIVDKPMALHYHNGHEVTIITKGIMKHQFGNRVELLYPGDVIYFDSRTPHGEMAVNGQDCEFFTVIMGSEENQVTDDIKHQDNSLEP